MNPPHKTTVIINVKTQPTMPGLQNAFSLDVPTSFHMQTSELSKLSREGGHTPTLPTTQFHKAA